MDRGGEAYTAFGLKTYLGTLSGPMGCPLDLPERPPMHPEVLRPIGIALTESPGAGRVWIRHPLRETPKRF